MALAYVTHTSSTRHTWHSPDKITHNEIDYICVNSKQRSSIKDVRSYRGADCGSDHTILIGKVKVKFKRLTKRKLENRPLDITKLRDNQIAENYRVELKNRFDALVTIDDDLEQKWTSFKTAITEAAKNTLGNIRGTHKEQWISKETWDLIDHRKFVKSKRDQAKVVQQIEDLNKEYNTINKKVKNACKVDKENWIENKCNEAEEAAIKNDTRTLFKVVRDLSNVNTSSKNVPIKSKSGKLLITEEEQLKRWE